MEKESPFPSDGVPPPRRYVAIAAMSFGIALVVIDGAIATVALPTISAALGIASASAILIVTVYQLVLVMALLPLSAAGDRLGHRRLYQSGQLLFAVASLGCLFATNLPALLVLRAFQAMGAAAVLSVSAAMLRRVYPAKLLGRGLAVQSVVVSCAAALAPTLGGAIMLVAPWPWIFAAAAPFALLSLVLGRTLPNPPPRLSKFDFPAALLCAASFGLTIGGLQLSVDGASLSFAAASMAGGVFLGTIFVRRQLREDQPIVPVDLLGKPLFALSIAASLTAFLSSMLLLLSLPFQLQNQFGFTPGAVGLIMAAWPIAVAITGPIAGMLSDRVPAGILGGLGMACATVSFVSFTFLSAPTIFEVGARMALCGTGFGLFLAPNIRLILGSAPGERAASIGALTSVTRLLGQTMGATITSALFAAGLGQGPVPMLVAAAFTLIAGTCSLARLRPSVVRR